jgi:hypothetical protein
MKHFEHFEADLDIPALAIDPDNLLVRQIHLGGQDRLVCVDGAQTQS